MIKNLMIKGIDRWLKGGLDVKEIDSPLDNISCISYIFKEIRLVPRNNNEMDKLDYWFFLCNLFYTLL